MKIKVNKNECIMEENEVWNVGDYNVHIVQVDLSSDFDELVNKVRYFVDENDYDMLISNGIAQVPREATLREGSIKIGVYGYEAETGILVQSTSPVNKYIASGTYTGEADNTEPLTPTDKQQMETAIQKNTDDINDIKDDIEDLKDNKQNVLVSGENIKTINNESILGSGNIDIQVGADDYSDLINKPSINNIVLSGNKSSADLGLQPAGNYALTQDLNDEIINRQNGDTALQNQIDAITASSDVIDILGTYQELQNYDTSHVKANDIIKVLQDNTHGNAISYYRWVITNHVGSWVYVGSEGPYYTKGETDTLVNAKQNEITSSNMLASDLVSDTNQTNKFVTATEKQTWNNKLDQSALANYVTKTSYATSSNAGVIKTGSLFNVDSNGTPYGTSQTYANYTSGVDTNFISKGTLENVITGKGLGTYSKPSGGIPATDLTTSVQNTLTKADNQVWYGTQAQYDAISQKNPDTLYCIVES